MVFSPFFLSIQSPSYAPGHKKYALWRVAHNKSIAHSKNPGFGFNQG
jgi:hypothetical protein